MVRDKISHDLLFTLALKKMPADVQGRGTGKTKMRKKKTVAAGKCLFTIDHKRQADIPG